MKVPLNSFDGCNGSNQTDMQIPKSSYALDK